MNTKRTVVRGAAWMLILIMVVLSLTGCPDPNDPNVNPFIGTWTGIGSGSGLTLVFSGTGWVLSGSGTAYGTYIYSGVTATLFDSSGDTATATISGNTLIFIWSGNTYTFTGGGGGPIGGDPGAPAAPGGLTATALSSSIIYLTWNAVPGATGYRVYASSSSGGTFSLLGAVSSNSAYHYDLSPNTTRYYRVRAYNGSGESGYLNTASATTYSSDGGIGGNQANAIQLYAGQWAGGYIPTGGEQWFRFTATASTQYIHVAFGTLYDVNVQLYNTGNNTVGSQENLYNNNGAGSYDYDYWSLNAGQTYYIKVWPFYEAHYGTYEIAFNTSSTRPGAGGGEPAPGAPGVPTGVRAVTASSTSITVSWDSVSNATGYRVYRSTSSDAGYSQVGGNISGTTYTNTGLTANTTYYYKVAAYNSSAEGSQSSYVYATTTLGNAPGAPTGVTALATGTSPRSSITVGWNSISNAVNYNLYRSTSADGYYTRVATPSTRSYEDTGLSAGVMYYYKVSATTTAGGEGAQSDYAYASTNADFPPPSAIPMSNGSWSYNTFNGGQSEAWYSFTATADTQYWVWCHDRDGGNTFDARISAYYADAQGSTIFNGHDNSWGSGARFTASRNVTVYIRVYPYSYSYLTGNPRTYGITFSTTSTRPN